MVDEYYKEVKFNKYCKLCKYKNQKESESPCDDCLSEPVNTNSEKPVYFRSVEK